MGSRKVIDYSGFSFLDSGGSGLGHPYPAGPLFLITALACKAIVLPPGTENNSFLIADFGVIVVGIAAAYWLVLMTRLTNPPASSSY